jgi:methylase of polypeptide subunit release factors
MSPLPAQSLDVVNAVGVSPVGRDTKVLARTAAALKAHSALDMGTGTGYVAIKLALQGVVCHGVDMNPAAIRCAWENARRNRAKVEFRESDLFENVEGRYDLIVFNPPFGNVGSARSTRLLEFVKSVLPKEQRIISWVAYRLIRRPRVCLIDRFLKECRSFLTDQGRVLILLHQSELGQVTEFSVEKMERWDELELVLLEPLAAQRISGTAHSQENH